MFKIIQVIPTSDFLVYVNVFKNKCTILNDTHAWDLSGKRDIFDCLDIDPLTIYQDGQEVTDPLAS